MLVDKYLNAIKDQRIDLIEYVDLEDVGTSPSEENLAIAKKYGVTATPVLVVTDSEGCLLYTSPSPRDLSTSRMPSSA